MDIIIFYYLAFGIALFTIFGLSMSIIELNKENQDLKKLIKANKKSFRQELYKLRKKLNNRDLINPMDT